MTKYHLLTDWCFSVLLRYWFEVFSTLIELSSQNLTGLQFKTQDKPKCLGYLRQLCWYLQVMSSTTVIWLSNHLAATRKKCVKLLIRYWMKKHLFVQMFYMLPFRYIKQLMILYLFLNWFFVLVWFCFSMGEKPTLNIRMHAIIQLHSIKISEWNTISMEIWLEKKKSSPCSSKLLAFQGVIKLDWN